MKLARIPLMHPKLLGAEGVNYWRTRRATRAPSRQNPDSLLPEEADSQDITIECL